MPYCNPASNAFAPGNPNVLASAFVHYGKRALLLVTNWGDTAVSNKIAVNWGMLGLSSRSPMTVVNSNLPLIVQNGCIYPPIKPRALTYVWIGSEDVGAGSREIYSDSMEGNDYSTR